MRHLALAVLLACMLSGTARAGEIPSTGAVAPPPPISTVINGEIQPVLTIILTLIGIVR